jgi:TRAP transporter TAXI family solute receptor
LRRKDLLSMQRIPLERLAALFALAAFGALILFSLNARGPGALEGARVSFQIATGPSDTTLFAISQAIAGLVSHPPGVGRCETSTVCGPSGVILSARTTQGAFDSLVAVNNGLVDSALVPADMVDAAVRGQNPFRRVGPLRNVRVIAALFAEQVQLVARSDIDTVAGLAGKRVATGMPGSDTANTARAVLSAFGAGRARRVRSDDPAGDLAAGKIDAFFVIAGAPSPAVTAALQGGKARLLPLDGEAALRLLQDSPQLMAGMVPAGAYPGVPLTPTLVTRAVWIVNARASDALVYGLARALFNPANREGLIASHPAAAGIGLSMAAQMPPAPLHSGAGRYYREVGKL